MSILSKTCKPDNFESHNSLKLSLTNIRGLRSNFVDCESFLESNSPDILTLCETNLDDSIDSGNFSVIGYLPLIRKDSSTHMHGFAVYVKDGPPIARDLSLENFADSYLCLQVDLLQSVSYFFFLYRLTSSSLCTVFDSISSNIDEVLPINPFVCLYLEALTSIKRTGLPILVELIDLLNSAIIFLNRTTLLRWFTFLFGSHTVTLTVLLFWNYFFHLTLVFVFFLAWQILILLLSQFSLTFHHIHNGMSHFIALLITILVLTGMVFVIICKMFHGRISLNSVLLLLQVNFVSGFRVELMYISLIEGIRSSLPHLHRFQLLVLLP